jgi:hypothetical protein
MRSERLRVLRAELQADLETFDRLEGKYRAIKAKLARIEPDEFDYIALAHVITNLYRLMENCFFRTAKCLGNAW